jgi:hypothetical protein
MVLTEGRAMMYRLVIGDPNVNSKSVDWLYYEENMSTVKWSARLLMRRWGYRRAKLVPYGYPLNGPVPPTITITVR